MGDADDKAGEHLSFSRLSTYSCAAKGYYSYERNLQVKGDQNVFAHAGHAGHAALNEYWRTEQNLDAALAVLEAGWGDFGGDNPLVTLAVEYDALEESFRNYISRYLKEDYEPVLLAPEQLQNLPSDVRIRSELAGGDELLSEFEIEFYIPGVDVPYVAILDRLMRHRPTGRLEVWDTKFTTSALDPFAFWAEKLEDRYLMSQQLIGYATAWRKILPANWEIEAGRIEVIYMGKNKKWERGETRMFDVFERWDDDLQLDFEAWVRARRAEILWRRQVNLWPQIDGGMMRQKICSKCQFQPICSTTYSRRPAVIALQYEPKERR